MRLEADKLNDVRKCAEVHRQVSSCSLSLQPCQALRHANSRHSYTALCMSASASASAH